nr:WS/DGAT domain-containing protein [Angustibacter aerolatus]
MVPLAEGQALSIGLTSYRGRVCYGLNGDRDAMPDLEPAGAVPGRGARRACWRRRDEPGAWCSGAAACWARPGRSAR